MSRTKPVNSEGWPSSDSMAVIDSSIGNSLPSARSAVSSSRWPRRRGSAPSARRRSAPRCASRSDSGMTSAAISFPSVSSREYPNSRSADGLNSTTLPLASIEITASSAVSKIDSLDRLVLARVLFRLLQLDVLAQLAAESAQQAEQLRVRGPQVARVELGRSDHAVLADHRERERARQPRLARDLRAQVALVAADVLGPGRLVAVPHLAGQPLAPRERRAPAQPDEAAPPRGRAPATRPRAGAPGAARLRARARRAANRACARWPRAPSVSHPRAICDSTSVTASAFWASR